MLEIFSSDVDEYGYAVTPHNQVVAVNTHKTKCLEKLETRKHEIVRFLDRTEKYLRDIHKLRVLYYNKLEVVESERRKLT